MKRFLKIRNLNSCVSRFCSRVLFFFIVGISAESWAVELDNGLSISDEISVVGEVDTHTFTASAGDFVYLRIADTETTQFVNSPFEPRIELRDPNGVFIAGSSGQLVGDLAVQVIVSGEYNVTAFDDSFGNDETGTYDLYFASIPGANEEEGGTLVNGESVSDRIDLGDIDTYTFTANAGDSVYLRVADTETTEFIASDFEPRVALFDPSGSFVIGSSGQLVGDIFSSLIVSGVYTVVVVDDSFGEDAVGDYDLYFALIPGANEEEGGALVNGESVSDRIDLGDIDTYTFTANAGDSVYLRVADTETTEFIPSDFEPRVALFDPSGSFVIGSSGQLVGDIFSSLIVSGVYTVVVVDDSFGEDAVGDYDLYFALIPGANELGGLSGGQTVNDFIDLGDLDTYAFTADTLGASISITVVDVDDAGLSPRVTLFDPSGAFITGSTNNSVATINATLTQSGSYTVVVLDDSFGEDAIGNYSITGVGAFTGVSPSGLFCNGLAVTVDLGSFETPTAGDDVIMGTSSSDLIDARAGNDTICAGGGGDIINAGGGNDWIDGGAGADQIVAGGGNDIVFGGNGVDSIDGGGGDDEIYGEAGNDILSGRTGEDLIDGGDGIDSISGGPSADTIFTGSGATVGSGVFVSGGAGADTITGGPDADDLRGGSGADQIFGESGNDVITGGIGRDDISGGPGNDDIRGQDSRDTLAGNSGNDTISGGAGNDDLSGGSGTDTCNGQGGDGDTVVGCETVIGVP